MSKKIEGGCFCGSVRYELPLNNYPSANCHCSMCRRLSGAPYVSWMSIPVRDFKYSQGKPTKIISSSHGSRYFCEHCGTPLVCILDEDPANIYITICSLDRPQEFEPKGDIYFKDRLPWIQV